MINLIIINDYAYTNGGASKVAIQTAVEMSKQEGFNVHFFAGSGEPCEDLKNAKIDVVSLRLFDLMSNPSRVRACVDGIYNRQVEKLFCEYLNQFDTTATVIHVHTWTKVLSSAVFKVACEKGFKVFLTLHDYFTVCPNGGFYNYPQNKICKLKPMGVQCLLCNCDKRSYLQKIWRCIRQYVQNKYIKDNPLINYITISDFSEKILRPYLAGKNFSRIYNPVDCIKNLHVDASKNDTFITISRVDPEKGIDLFCDAIGRLGYKGLVFGDGICLEEYKKKYPFVQFVGWKSKEEMRSYIQQARALVFPSRWYETAGLVIKEMRGCGLPCIVPDECAASEFVQDGVDGLVFKTGNLESLIEKMKMMKEKATLFRINADDCQQDDNVRYVQDLMNVYFETDKFTNRIKWGGV